MSDDARQIDETTVRDFLELVLQRNRFHLYRIDPYADKPTCRGYVARDTDDAVRWVREWNGQEWNIYYALNTPSDHLSKKATHEELKWLHGQYVDIDLPKEWNRKEARCEAFLDEAVARLEACLTLPGRPAIYYTGNGVQAVWMFAKPLKATEDNKNAVATINKRLGLEFGGDKKVYDVARILRVPGTWNFPSAKKEESGCYPILVPDALVWEASQDFELADFTRLPRVTPVTLVGTPKRIDYTEFPYIEDDEPFTWEEIKQLKPEMNARASEMLRKKDGDRSTALWWLLKDLCDFFMVRYKLSAFDICTDRDVKKNISEILWAAYDDHTVPHIQTAMQHVMDHAYGRGHLGFSIDRMLADEVEHNARPTAIREQRQRQRTEDYEATQKPTEEVTVEEAERLFIVHVKACAPDLPNSMADAKGGVAHLQPPTKANVRKALTAAGIRPMWDAMRDRAVFEIDEEAGIDGGAPLRPAVMFDIACSRTLADYREQTELSLVLDALTEVGLRARETVREHLLELAREDQFHPLEEYCTRQKWDGRDRITEIAECLRSDHELRERYLSVFFRQCIAAVKSHRRFVRSGRGEMIGSVVILVGRQRMKKSTFWEKLTPLGFEARGSSLNLTGASQDRDSKKQCLTGLVCQLAEFDQTLDRSSSSALKDFITQHTDSFRPAWARTETTRGRMTVFVGSANEDLRLRDVTGSFRYLVLPVDHIDFERLNKLLPELQQVYAQAWHEVMEEGKTWWLSDEELNALAGRNEEYHEVNEVEGKLAAYLSKCPLDCKLVWRTATEICELLDVRYISTSWTAATRAMRAHELPYKDRVRQKGKPDLRKVWGFPELPHGALRQMARGR